MGIKYLPIDSFKNIYLPLNSINFTKDHSNLKILVNRYDILVGLIFLYVDICILSEVSYWIKKDWGIDIPNKKIRNIYNDFNRKRIMKYSLSFFAINPERVPKPLKDKIINYGYNIYILSHEYYNESYALNINDLNKALDNNTFSLDGLLHLKRLMYAYNLSDMLILENYKIINSSHSLTHKILNSTIDNIEIGFYKRISELENQNNIKKNRRFVSSSKLSNTL